MAFVVAACSDAPPSTGSQPMATASATAPAIIDLRPLTISFRGHTIAKLLPGGRTESAGQNAPGTQLVPGPTLHADGTIVLTKAGVTARIDKTGNFYVSEPAGPGAREELFGRITDDQFMFSGSDRWSVRVRGNVIEFGKHNSSQIDGDVTPAMRHTALVMAAAFYLETSLAGG
jgi:hypothetical protein